MPSRGIEPPWIAPHASETCLSTSFNTTAGLEYFTIGVGLVVLVEFLVVIVIFMFRIYFCLGFNPFAGMKTVSVTSPKLGLNTDNFLFGHITGNFNLLSCGESIFNDTNAICEIFYHFGYITSECLI